MGYLEDMVRMKHAEARTLIATLETALGESSKSWKLDHDRKNEFKMWLQEAKEQIEIDVKAITMPVLRNQPDSRVFVASEFAELSDGLKHIEWAVRIGGIRPAEITNPEELVSPNSDRFLSSNFLSQYLFSDHYSLSSSTQTRCRATLRLSRHMGSPSSW